MKNSAARKIEKLQRYMQWYGNNSKTLRESLNSKTTANIANLDFAELEARALAINGAKP